MLPVLLGLGLLIGGALIVANWEAITDWLKDFIPKLRMAWETIRALLSGRWAMDRRNYNKKSIRK